MLNCLKNQPTGIFVVTRLQLPLECGQSFDGSNEAWDEVVVFGCPVFETIMHQPLLAVKILPHPDLSTSSLSCVQGMGCTHGLVQVEGLATHHNFVGRENRMVKHKLSDTQPLAFC